MSSTTEAKPALPPHPPGASFDIGWREITTRRPDGTWEYQQIPLTLKDALHPREGDVILESNLHGRVCSYLRNVGETRLVGDPTALVLHDVGVYWDDPELDHHSPDISVIFGVRRHKDNWKSFYVTEEGVRPKVLMEVVSPNTRENDVATKVGHYHQARVPFYIIIDRETDDSPWKLIGYQYTPRKYVPMQTDERGRLWIEPLGIWLGVDGNRVICYDGETDEEIPDYLALTEAREAEKARAEAERTRAEVEKERAEAAAAQAEAEKTRAETAENRLRELEAELARLRGQSNP
jgi:Uma2 family endonuclease